MEKKHISKHRKKNKSTYVGSFPVSEVALLLFSCLSLLNLVSACFDDLFLVSF